MLGHSVVFVAVTTGPMDMWTALAIRPFQQGSNQSDRVATSVLQMNQKLAPLGGPIPGEGLRSQGVPKVSEVIEVARSGRFPVCK